MRMLVSAGTMDDRDETDSMSSSELVSGEVSLSGHVEGPGCR